MRQRKPKNLEEKLAECSEFIVDTPSPEVWTQVFHKGEVAAEGDEERKLFLEIGCGKGNFITKKARENPDSDFIAIEGQETVILRALEKMKEAETEGNGISNLKFVCAFINNMDDMFKRDSLDGIYLNFSDPWPKARHAKRRLTYRDRLRDYGKALKPGGFIEIKTDNEGLFEFTLEEIDELGLEKIEFTRDLHSTECTYEAKNTMTEYEVRFKEKGKNINYVKVCY